MHEYSVAEPFCNARGVAARWGSGGGAVLQGVGVWVVLHCRMLSTVRTCPFAAQYCITIVLKLEGGSGISNYRAEF